MPRKFKVMELGCSYGPTHRQGAELRFRGHWLRELGFHPGAFVTVESPEPGVLQLRLDRSSTGASLTAVLAPFQKLGL